MKKHFLVKLATSAAVALSLMSTLGAANNQAQASSTGYLNRKAYIYTAKGRRSKAKALSRGRKIKNYGVKWIKHKKYFRIGKNKYIRSVNVSKKQSSLYSIKIKKNPIYDTKQQLPSAESYVSNLSSMPKGTEISWKKEPVTSGDDQGQAVIKAVFPDKSTKTKTFYVRLYGTDHIKLPAGYTLADVTAADNSETDTASASLKKATSQGYDLNSFIPESVADDQEKVTYDHLTAAQKTELSQFAVRLINEVREQVGSEQVTTDDTVQDLADKVALQYEADNYSYDQGHDENALYSVLDEHGWSEDMMAFFPDQFNGNKVKTMTDMKQIVYDSMLAYLFVGTEWHHAGSICGDDDYDMNDMAVSFSYSSDKMYCSHFIFID